MKNDVSRKIIPAILAIATSAINPTPTMATEETSSCSSCWSWFRGSSSNKGERLLDHEIGVNVHTSAYVPPQQTMPMDGQKSLSKRVTDLLDKNNNCSRAIQQVIERERGPGVYFDITVVMDDTCEISINRDGTTSTLIVTFEPN